MFEHKKFVNTKKNINLDITYFYNISTNVAT